MLKNKKFARYSIAFCVLGILFMFMYSGLQNDQINIIQSFSAWSKTSTQQPLAVGNLVCIALTFVFGTLFIKFGVRKTLIPCIVIAALGCIGLVAANGLACTNEALTVSGHASNDPLVVGNYWLFWISLFAIRCCCMCLQMAGFQLASSWFVRYRGRVLGIISLGSPLFSVLCTSVMTSFISRHLGGDYRPFYVGIAVVLVLMAFLTALLLRDSPEDAGLFPDGADHPPASEREEEETLSVRQVLSMKKSWLMICNYGAYQFIVITCMSSLAAWFTYLCVTNADVVATGKLGALFMELGGLKGTGASTLFIGQATKWLSVGAILGIPMSFVFGTINDKLGTAVASVILVITELCTVISLMAQHGAVAATGSCSVPMLILWGFGVGCMTGGTPALHPASINFAFGHRAYQSDNRVIMAIQLIPSAVGTAMMIALIDAGKGMLGYWILLAVVLFGIATTIPMFMMKDANAADRG
jgi:MFS family permease